MADNGLTMNTQSELVLKENELALKVLKDKQIDLADKRVKLESLNLKDSEILGAEESSLSNLRQVNLGTIIVNSKDSILLEDVDIDNIPEDKDILLERKEKELKAIGVKVKKS